MIFFLSFFKMLTNILFQMIYPIIIYLTLLESIYMFHTLMLTAKCHTEKVYMDKLHCYTSAITVTNHKNQ
jgi:hypothetical protein